jgi:hypothetical protein
MSNEQFMMLLVITLLSGVILGVKMGLGNHNKPYYERYPVHDPYYNNYTPQRSSGSEVFWGLLVLIFLVFTMYHTNLLVPNAQTDDTAVKVPKTTSETPQPKQTATKKSKRVFIIELQSQRLDTYQEAAEEVRRLESIYPNIGRTGYFLNDDGEYLLYLGPYNSPDEANDARKMIGLYPDDAVITDAAGLELY